MKALTTLLFITTFSISIFAQETEESENQKKEEQELKENSKEEVEPVEKKEVNEQDSDRTTETKSFTLDANDAILEEKVISDPQPVFETSETSNKTYHYNSYHRQDDIQTLAGKHGHNGGFGAATFKATEFNNKDIIMIGFRGGWIINRAMAIGFEGHGIVPTAEYENIDASNPLNSRSVGGYGGLFLEPIVLSNQVVHVTFPISGGAGWLGYIVDWEHNNNIYVDDLIDDDIFWYIEPGAALELNVARNFRINMGASYRFTKDLNLMSTSSTAFDAWNYFLTLKFGSF